MKTGIIDVGGGLRGIYTAGVLDFCLEHEIEFDVAIGISAGAANLSSFLSKQKKRCYTFFADYSFRKEYMGIKNLIFKRSFFDFNYIYSTLAGSDGENPFDYETFKNSKTEYYAVATEAETGHAKYFTKADIKKDNYLPLAASSSIPVICPPLEIDGVKYFDGALSDTIPLEKAFSLGCDKVVIMLTKPADIPRTPDKDIKLAKFIRKKYPICAKQFEERAKRYNKTVELAKKYERDGKVLIVSPEDTCGVDTIKRDKDSLDRLYKKGYDDGVAIIDFLK